MKDNNSVSKWFVGLSVLLVVVGVVMLVWPNLTMDLLGIMIGICMLVVGIAHIILYFTKDRSETVLQMDLAVGVVLSAFGAFMLMHKDFVNLALPFAAAIVLLIGGILKIQYALDMKRLCFRYWNILLIVAIAMIVFALVLLYNPFREKVLIYVIGGSLIVDGALSIASILMISHRLKKMAKGAVYTGYDRQITEKTNHAENGGGSGMGPGMNEGGMPGGAVPPMETVEEPVVEEPAVENPADDADDE